jgi:hypothetical protein
LDDDVERMITEREGFEKSNGSVMHLVSGG